ncbi:MAG TPA: sigma-70 family RNA polymerase sigma factor [Cyclobacteriaceae bacterium]|nr:sigma-70 family RNA polymerase sigma factor [Cyclobacteriaceae bacterium]
MSDGLDHEGLRKLMRFLPEKAINILYEQYYHQFLRISEHFTHDDEAAKDIVQDAFALVWEKRRVLSRSDKSISNFMGGMVRNRSISYYLEHVKNFEDIEKLLDHAASGMTAEPAEVTFIRAEVAQAMRAYVSTFPRRERQCLLMKVDKEMSPDQIARKLGVGRKAVERSLTSARKRLRKYWDDIQ